MTKKLRFFDLGRKPYRPVWDFQKKLASKIMDGDTSDALVFVEHDPVYTLGKNANSKNITASESFLQSRGIEVVKIDRGGDVTYHGPGQLVGYPILNLIRHKQSVSWYIHSLEETLIQALRDLGVEASRIKGLTGVWIGREKIAAIGVRITQWVTMHGFALNVTTDLSHYHGIIPCGIPDKGVTSLHHFLPGISMEEVKSAVLQNFKNIFGYTEIENFPEDNSQVI